MSDLYPLDGWAFFRDVFDAFKDWIRNHVDEYVEELQLPDLWSEYKEGNNSLRFTEINFENQEDFNSD